MANQGAKKRLEENAKHLGLLFNVAFGATVLHCLVRLVLLRSSAGWFNFFLAGSAALLQLFCYGFLKSAAAPTYGPNGELLDAGSDLKLGGITEYCKDLIYVTALVQILSLLSDWLWLLLLVVPGFASYMFWVNIAAPWIFTPDPEPQVETDAERRKREKMERKAGRQKVVYRR